MMKSKSAKEQVREIIEYLAESYYPEHEYGDMQADQNKELIDQALSQIEGIVMGVLGKSQPFSLEKEKENCEFDMDARKTEAQNNLRTEQLNRWSKDD